MKKKGRPITRVSRSHKLVSFLLTLVLLFTLFPTTALPASALGPIDADDEATLITPEQRYTYISGDSEELPASIQAGNPITDMPGTFLLSNKDNGSMILYTPIGNYAFPGIFSYSSDPDGDAWIFQCLDENRYVIRSAWDSNFAFCGMGSTFMLSDSFHSNEGIFDTYCWDLEYAVGGGVYIRNADSGYVLKCDGSSFSLISEPSINHADHDRTVFYMVERSEYVMLTDFSLTNNYIAPGDTSSFSIICTPAGAVWKSGNHFSYSIVSHGTGSGHQFSVTKDGSVTAPVNGGTATLTMTQMHTGFTKSFTIKSGILPEGTYRFQNKRTKRYLDIDGPSIANDAFLHQWGFHLGEQEQWNLIIQPDGTYAIQSEYSGKYMHVAGGYTYDGANIVQYQWTGSSHSFWQITQTSSGAYRITPTSATSLALGVPVGQDGDGTRLAQIYYGNDSEYSDEWRILGQKHYANVIVQMDQGFVARYGSNATSRIEYAIKEAGKFYLEHEDFSIWLNFSPITTVTSYADQCGTAYNQPCYHCCCDCGGRPNDPNCTCELNQTVQNCVKCSDLYCENDSSSEPNYHHKNIYHILSELSTPSNPSVIKILFTGHDTCEWITTKNGSTHEVNQYVGLADPSESSLVISDHTSNIFQVADTIIHEIGHMFGTPDHYGDITESTIGLNNDPKKPDGCPDHERICIYGEDSAYAVNYYMCAGCRWYILLNIDRYVN